MKRFDSVANSCCEPAEDPLAAKGKLLSSQHISGSLKAVTQVDHGKLDSIPQLVAPVPISYHTLDVQVDVSTLQYT